MRDATITIVGELPEGLDISDVAVEAQPGTVFGSSDLATVRDLDATTSTARVRFGEEDDRDEVEGHSFIGRSRLEASTRAPTRAPKSAATYILKVTRDPSGSLVGRVVKKKGGGR